MKKYIDIGDFSDLLLRKVKEFDKNQMQIFEEVIYLCINKEFIKDVHKIRSYFNQKYSKIKLPTDDTRRAEGIVRFLYLKHYKKYKNFINNLLNKYKIIPEIYWEDKFKHLNMYIEGKIEDAYDFDEKITKKEARIIAMDERLSDFPLSLIDNIILRNAPYKKEDTYPFWNNPYFTRKPMDGFGTSILVRKDSSFKKIYVGFPAYVSLSEMKKMLTDDYKKIQEYRASVMPVPAKKDYRKVKMSKSVDAYMMKIRGKKIEKIAIRLDEKYGGEHTFESIEKMIERMRDESKRFDYDLKLNKGQEKLPF